MAKKQKGGAGRMDAWEKARASQDRSPPSKGDGEGLPFKPWTLLLFGAVFLIMFNEGLRDATGVYVGYVLDPAIGFGGNYPALTIFCASVITGVSTGVIRHYMVDWMEMAEVQETVKAFQKELKQARKDENKYKVKRLTELQPELMKLQTGMSGQQFKPMGYTMVIVIPMFAWLWNFIQNMPAAPGMDTPVIFSPWGTTELLSSAPVVSFLPTWILIYSLFSIPLGQLVQKALKAVEFSRKLDSDAEAHV